MLQLIDDVSVLVLVLLFNYYVWKLHYYLFAGFIMDAMV
jgi:hypothetical protein